MDDLKERMRKWWEYDPGHLFSQALTRIEALEKELETETGFKHDYKAAFLSVLYENAVLEARILAALEPVTSREEALREAAAVIVTHLLAETSFNAERIHRARDTILALITKDVDNG